MPFALSRRAALALPAALAVPVVRAQAPVTITVHYAQPFIFKESYDAIAEAFAKREPNIRIEWLTTPNYEEGMQLILRQAATNQLPDLSYQGFNRLRLFAERGIAQDLLPLLRAEGDPAALGYTPGILALAHFGGFQSGLAYAASNPITYYNADLVRRAGGDPDAMPTDWAGHIRLAARIKALGDGNEGMFFRWSGDDWMFSALLFGHGGRMLTKDERDIAFAGREGLESLRLIDAMVKQGGMANLSTQAAQQAFAAGKLGLFYWTTAVVRGTIQQVGSNFALRTGPMPVIDAAKGRLPTGGAAGMLTARDPAKRDAAWKFLRFSTSAEGTALMVQNTGYVPMNQIAIDDPRFLGAFYRDNPLYTAAVRQVPISIPWYAFPGANSVRVTQTMVDNIARVVEQRATPDQVLPDMAAEVRRLLPRRA
ncbi:ABC transporter substrate-binding protein [Paracraurococcus ruber]|uniref:ABC transporter substrate-binding protein n=1 Tax=Paracraurococcus ruber TaxID=77675 RepID=A0ABS1D186_9PROT|nr:ABC transporter substrate-binding protein [Paracraurococcus ruber]MBK1659689.1 ABC transporter substrate-binding protein [Paracraurococcus ruber]TDG29196.1 ABC transporter substrate-binding protein [Paracraurococcus ruber]